MNGLICQLLTLYVFIIFGRILLSWFPLAPNGAMATVYSFLFRITEPVLGPVRRLVPFVRLGGAALDLSPIIVLFGISFLSRIVC